MSAKSHAESALRSVRDAESNLRHISSQDPTVQGLVHRALNDVRDAERHLNSAISDIRRETRA